MKMSKGMEEPQSSKEAETIKEAESSKEPETSSNSKLMTSAIFMCCICTIAVDETVVSLCAPTPSPPLCDYAYLKEEDFFQVASPGVVTCLRSTSTTTVTYSSGSNTQRYSL